MAEQFTPEERSLIERLQNAPQPTLNPDRFETIRAQMLHAMDAPPVPAPRTGFTPSVPVIAAVVVVIVVIIVVIVSGIFTPQSSEPTLVPSLTVPPTLGITATPEATSEATEESTPEATPESTDEAVIVIEGPVESIDGNIITIFGVPIEINPDDPLLDTIEVGDVIHVEADSGTTVITAITITYVDVEVNVDPSSGEVWRDDGSCAHPPPDWAPANGWRRRCEGQTKTNNGKGNNGNGNGNSSGNGNGNGMGKP